VQLADDITPGQYHYYCNLHTLRMQGMITVKPKASTLPSAADVDAAAKSQLDALVEKVLPAYQGSKTKIPVEGATALGGFGTPDAKPALVDEFILPVIDAHVGQTVTWAVIGPHTISFNADPSLQNFISVAADGSVSENPKSYAPAGGPGYTPTEATGPPPSGPPKLGKVVDGGNFDGTGFKSSGFFAPGPPPLPGYSLTFTKPGTFSYVCLIHPKMGGVVKVT